MRRTPPTAIQHVALPVIALLCGMARPGAGAWSADVRLTDAPSSSDTPALAIDAQERVHLVWEDNRHGRSEIFYKQYENGAWSADERVTENPAGAYWPSVAAESNGALHLVWHDQRHGNAEIYHKRWNGAWSADERLTNEPAVSSRPSIAITPTDEVHVVWYDSRDGNFEIYWKKWDGSAWSADTRLTDNPGYSREPAIAADSSGNVHLVWSDDSSGDLEIYYSSWDGASWSAAERLTVSPGFSEYPAIVVGPAGSLHVVWIDGRDGSNEVFYKRKEGGVWSGDLRLSDVPFWTYGVALAVDDQERIHVVWGDQRDGNYEVYYKEFREGVWSADQRITDDPSSSLQPAVAAGPPGTVHVVWSDGRIGPTNSELYWKIRSEIALAVADASVNEGNAGTVNASFTVTLSAASGDTVKVAYATADGTATAADGDYVPASGQIIFEPGAVAAAVQVLVNGDAAVEPDEIFFVNLSAPVNAVLADTQGVGTILNDDGVPALSIDDVTVTEGDGGTTNAVFTVSLSAPSSSPVTVLVRTANGTAAGGADYVAIAPADTVSFPSLTTTRAVTVTVLGDMLDEEDETYVVHLSDATNAAIADSQGVGTILDDDAAPAAAIDDVSLAEGNTGTTNFVFSVTLSAASGKLIRLLYATADSSAQAAADYAAIAPPETLLFAPGDSLTKTVTVVVNGDGDFEPDETFFVNLSDPVNVTVAAAQGRGVILNDDQQVAVESPIPARTFLGAGYPNPFSGLATIPFGLKESGPVTIRIFDVRGRLVRNLATGLLEREYRRAEWDGRDQNGSRAASGVYIVRMEAGGRAFTQTLKLVR